MKIGFIGAGNMAGALAFGAWKSGLAKADELYISAKTREHLGKFEDTGMHVGTDNAFVTEHADVVVLAVKPNVFPEILGHPAFQKRNTLFISVAAGISIQKIKELLGFDAKVVRAMPNTPAKVGEGMSVLSYCEPCREEDYKIAETLFSSVGKVQLIAEAKMNEIIAVTGSSPAYVYYFIDRIAKKAEEYGFSYQDGTKLAAQAVLGSAKMVLEEEEGPDVLKARVCSKGGTTLAALEKLEDGRFSDAISEAMDACVKRAYELGK